MKLHANVEGNGFPLFILHGFLGMGDNWKTLGKEYADAGFQVHLIDQRNHGRSPHSSEFNYTVLAEDVKQYAEDNQISKFSIIGHSMGGKTAMQLACQHPELIEKLVVADIAPKYYEPHHQQILEGLTRLEEAEISSRKEADQLLSEFISEQGIRMFLLKNLNRKEKNAYGLRVNLSALKQNIEEVGKALAEDAHFNGETLFLKGSKSNYITDEDKKIIHQHFPEAKIESIQGAGHWLHAEKKDAFFEASISFLKA
ncbi:alpha/beta fold hydrolase [Psychroflexus planctonicus]|uniref:Alpha/beta hydrolase n=1 Tax=Psychroflexus planctonicus TaxID=1526575 RepID=A0ABQ1SHC7_9FLAO|nr:alpha/beta fold hydrolase [Psychroflexus planctonicus]GGE38722.1 alpha/beta hydrolase [Psychroflexus planctonicus]